MAYIRSARNGLVIGIPSDTIGVMPRFNIGESNRAVIRPVQEHEFAKARKEHKALTSMMADHTEQAAPQKEVSGDTVTAAALEDSTFGAQAVQEAEKAEKIGRSSEAQAENLEDLI